MINTKLSLLLFLTSGVVSPTSARFGGWGGGHGGGGHGGGGKGGGHGGGGMGGHGGMSKRDMMDLIHDLIDNREIEREKGNTENGIWSYTYSKDEEVGGWIQLHVQQMMSLMNSENAVFVVGMICLRSCSTTVINTRSSMLRTLKKMMALSV